MKTILFFTLLLITVQLVLAQDQINGYKKIVFDKKYGIKSKFLSFVIEDTKADATWFKSEDCIFKFKNDTLYTFKQKNDKLIKYANGEKLPKMTNFERYLVSVFFNKKYWIDNKNNLWVFDNNQLNKIIGSKLQRYALSNDSINDIGAITEDRNGDIWFSMKTMGILKLTGENIVPNYALSGNGVYLTFVDSKNNIWFCTDDGVIILNDQNVAKFSNSSANIMYQVSSIFEVDDSTICLSSYKGHTSYFNGRDWIGHNVFKKYIHESNVGIGFGLIGAVANIAYDNISSEVDATPFPSMLIRDKNKNLYLHDCDNLIYKLDNTSNTITNSFYPWKSSIHIYRENASFNALTSQDYFEISNLFNRLVTVLTVEEIDKIDWQKFMLIHLDNQNNLWFQKNTAWFQDGNNDVFLFKRN